MLNAEADIPVEELLRLYHPELYAASPEKTEKTEKTEKPEKPETSAKRRKEKVPEKEPDRSSDDEKKSKAEENDDQVMEYFIKFLNVIYLLNVGNII
jgi:negative regulator of genetic competence, sporulation and motility